MTRGSSSGGLNNSKAPQISTFHRSDICDRESLRTIFNTSYDAVINLAARAGVRHSVEDPWVYQDTNVTGTLNLLDLCREFEVKKFVLASTSSLYGDNNPLPFSEEADTDGPLSPYAASKKRCPKRSATATITSTALNVTIFRFFTVYGTRG